MCEHHLGTLPCTRPDPHPGNGQGCTHEADSGIPDAHTESSGE